MTLVKVNRPNAYRTLVNDAWLRSLNDGFLGNATECNYNNVQYNVKEEDKEYIIDFAVPGYTKEDLTISVENEKLTVKTTFEKEDESYWKKPFEKSFKLSAKINKENITAKTENGILRLTLAKAEEAIKKPAREISIQ